MQLIIKATSKCNFNCSFCSAKNLKLKHNVLNDKQVRNQIQILKPNDIIITGGEPLMVNPQSYLDLLTFLDSIGLNNTSISITSNLSIFKQYPEKWVDVFKNSRINVATSFHYGSNRGVNGNWTEDKFIETENLFKSLIGYCPIFISVIDESNYDIAIKNVELAKKLETCCKLNNCLPMGGGKYFSRAKMFKLWNKIIDLGLEQYECNCRDRNLGKCGLNTNLLCESTIRTCWVSEDNKFHYSNCEDFATCGFEFEPETTCPKPLKSRIMPFKDECWSCKLFKICNGCRFNAKCVKDSNMIEDYCNEMKQQQDEIEKKGWLL